MKENKCEKCGCLSISEEYLLLAARGSHMMKYFAENLRREEKGKPFPTFLSSNVKEKIEWKCPCGETNVTVVSTNLDLQLT